MNFLLDNILYIGIAVLSGGALLLPALMPSGKRASTQQVVQIKSTGCRFGPSKELIRPQLHMQVA